MAKRGRKAGLSPVVPNDVQVPATLSADETREFLRLVEACRAVGSLAKADTRLIEAAARTVCLLDRAHNELGQVEGGKLTMLAANGTPMPHPMLAVIGSQTMRLRGLLKDLGLTPSSFKSSGVGQGKPAEDDKWGNLLSVTA